MQKHQCMGTMTMAAGFLAVSLMSGCMSAYRTVSTLEPSNQPVPQANSTKFNLTSVGFVNPTNIPASELPSFGDPMLESCYDYTVREQKMPDGTVAMVSTPVRNQRHRDLLMTAGMKAYPQVFSADAGAIPLQVTITRTSCTNEMPGNPCVSCLTLTIAPLRQRCRTDYAVEVKTQDQAVNRMLERPVTFSRITQSSSSCLIPASMMSVSGNNGTKLSGDAATKHAGDLTVNACIESVVQSIRRVEPATWERLRPAPQAK